jgi:hypothetical protein
MIRALGYLTFVLIVAASGAQAQVGGRGSVAVAAPSAAAPKNYRHTLTGAEIRAEIVGNTITGADKEGDFTEFLDGSGVIRGVSGSNHYQGQWRIQGDQICFFYDDLDPSDPNANKWDCNSVTVDNGNIYWSDQVDEEDRVDASLAVGNPNGL